MWNFIRPDSPANYEEFGFENAFWAYSYHGEYRTAYYFVRAGTLYWGSVSEKTI